ncbi:MAG: hypothetical protein R3285_10510 [Kiloniellales bacterium]|nr:hypothetical protein [Kiloniellales bacterium]
MKTTTSRTAIRIAAALALFLLAVGGLSFGPGPAAAQGVPTACAKRDALISQLANRYGEVPVAIGVANGRLVELLTAKDGITWTIILTNPQGISCLIASGDGWRPITPVADGPAV